MYSKEEVVKEQMRKLDHSHTSIERALQDAWDAGRLSAGEAVAETLSGSPDAEVSATSNRRKKKTE